MIVHLLSIFETQDKYKHTKVISWSKSKESTAIFLKGMKKKNPDIFFLVGLCKQNILRKTGNIDLYIYKKNWEIKKSCKLFSFFCFVLL